MEQLLAKLVAMPTIAGDIAANDLALDYLERFFSDRGMYIKRLNAGGFGSLVATIKPNVKKVKILLYAHVDVMPGSDDVFSLRRDGDRLYGRGTLDMKFAIAAYMQVIDTIKDTLHDYDFAIMITSDEELGGRDGVNGIEYLLQEGYRSEVCVMPDGGRAWDVEAVAKGFWRFDLVASGKSAHGSRPWEGDSASFKLIHALHELRTYFKDHGPDTDTLNIGQIHGDGTYNQIPSHMSAQVEIRLSTDDSYARNETFVRSLCKKHHLTISPRGFSPLLYQDIKHPLVQAFMESITRQTGHQSRGCLSQAASDAPYFNAVGIPCILTYLPGGGHHGEREWVSSRALSRMPLVVQDYLERNAVLVQPPMAPVDTDAALV